MTLRLLHRHSAHGYTTDPTMAMRHEPEALTSDELHQLAAQAADHADAERRAQLEQVRQQLVRRLEYHQAQARHLQRRLARLTRTV